MISLAEMKEGLYVLFNPSPNSTTLISYVIIIVPSFPPASLWHYRLDHPSQSRILALNKLCSSVPCNVNTHVYDIYHYAKHKKLSFPLSVSHTVALFQLVLADI